MKILKALTLFLALIFGVLSCLPNPREIDFDLGQARLDPIIRVNIDTDFSLREQKLIQKAFNEWEKASNYKIKFIPKYNVPKPGPFWKYDSPKANSGTFIWSLNSQNTYHFPSKERREDLGKDWGLADYGENEYAMNILIFKNTPEYKFYPVVLHEIGHLLGIRHIEEKGVLTTSPSATHLTEADIAAFNELYNGYRTISRNKHQFRHVMDRN